MFSSAFVCLLAALREIYSRDNTRGEITCFQGVSYVPSHGLGPSVPQIFGMSYMTHTQYGKQQRNFAWWSKQTWSNFYTVDHECWCAICLR